MWNKMGICWSVGLCRLGHITYYAVDEFDCLVLFYWRGVFVRALRSCRSFLFAVFRAILRVFFNRTSEIS